MVNHFDYPCREGELNGASGTFPASYVVSLSEVKKSFTAPEDTPATETVPVAPVAAPAAAAVEPPSTGQSPKSALAKADGRRKKSLSWSLEQNSEEYTFGKSEYVLWGPVSRINSERILTLRPFCETGTPDRWTGWII